MICFIILWQILTRRNQLACRSKNSFKVETFLKNPDICLFLRISALFLNKGANIRHRKQEKESFKNFIYTIFLILLQQFETFLNFIYFYFLLIYLLRVSQFRIYVFVLRVDITVLVLKNIWVTLQVSFSMKLYLGSYSISELFWRSLLTPVPSSSFSNKIP